MRRGNHRLFSAYQLRVDFEGLWECATQEEAARFIGNWTRSVRRAKFAPLCRFADTIAANWWQILGFFRRGRVTNATLEGTNNVIKLIIHRAFGFHSVDALKAMVYLCCSGIELTP